MNLNDKILKVQLKEKLQYAYYNFEFIVLALCPLVCGILAHFVYPDNPILVGIGVMIGLVIGMAWMGIQESIT